MDVSPAGGGVMAQQAGRRYMRAFVGGFFVAVPVTVTALDRLAYVARVEGASMQPSLNPEGGSDCDVVLLNRWSVRNYEVQRGDVVSVIVRSHTQETDRSDCLSERFDSARATLSHFPFEVFAEQQPAEEKPTPTITREQETRAAFRNLSSSHLLLNLSAEKRKESEMCGMVIRDLPVNFNSFSSDASEVQK
ncbi:hypothetical protein NQZ68_030569 [Dissostichus eleginoides]|nr:hypothetical protein NQZ68_030569 [Dissostichus eleginoides]